MEKCSFVVFSWYLDYQTDSGGPGCGRAAFSGPVVPMLDVDSLRQDRAPSTPTPAATVNLW